MIKTNGNGEYTGIVYLRKNLNQGAEFNWGYVGCTLDPAERNRKWNNPKTTNYGGKKIMEARGRLGVKNFSYDVLETYTDTDKHKLREKLHERESYYIQKLDTINKGYNSSNKGEGSAGLKKSAEEIARRNATRKANGFHHTEETKKHLSELLKGKKRSPEFRAAVSNGLKGKKKSLEHRAKQSSARKGIAMSPEARAKSSATKKGKPHPISAEGMARINAARVRHPVLVTDTTDNSQNKYDSKASAARALNVNVGSVASAVKTKGLVRNRWRITLA